MRNILFAFAFAFVSVYLEASPRVAVGQLVSIADAINSTAPCQSASCPSVSDTLGFDELTRIRANIEQTLNNSGFSLLTHGEQSQDQSISNLADLIAEIKKGRFSSAEFVLFGKVSQLSLQYADLIDCQEIDKNCRGEGFILRAQFNLVNTSTYEIFPTISEAVVSNAPESSASNEVDTASGGAMLSQASLSLAEKIFPLLKEQLFDHARNTHTFSG